MLSSDIYKFKDEEEAKKFKDESIKNHLGNITGLWDYIRLNDLNYFQGKIVECVAEYSHSGEVVWLTEAEILLKFIIREGNKK